MCGIIGYTGYRQASPVLLDALKRLEYRGYDSAGIAVLTPTLEVHKKKGEIKELLKTLPEVKGTIGIGHTRWASCGKPSATTSLAIFAKPRSRNGSATSRWSIPGSWTSIC